MQREDASLYAGGDGNGVRRRAGYPANVTVRTVCRQSQRRRHLHGDSEENVEPHADCLVDVGLEMVGDVVVVTTASWCRAARQPSQR